MRFSKLWQLLLACCLASHSVYGQGNLSSVVELWPTLANLSQVPQAGNTPLAAGGLDFHMCCLLALNESVQIVNRSLAFVPGQTFLHGNISVFASFPSPCDYDYKSGYEASVPQGRLTYSWCATRCAGWSQVPSWYFTLWALPIITFILPAIVFSINIPRRYPFHIPEVLFPSLKLPWSLAVIWTAPLAGVLAAVEILIWMALVLSMAGPMLISGLLESLIDRRIIRYLNRQESRNTFTIRQRGHILLLALIGHLDLDPAWQASDVLLEYLPDEIHAAATPLVRSHLHKAADILKLLLSSQVEYGPLLGIGLVFFLSTFVYSDLEIYQNKGGSQQAHSLALGIFWMVIPHVAIIATSLLAGSNPATWTAVAKNLEVLPPHPAIPKPPRRPIPAWHIPDQNVAPPVEGRNILRTTLITIKRALSVRISKLAGVMAIYVANCWADVVEYKHQAFAIDPDTLYKQQWMWNRGPNKASWIRRLAEEHPEIDFIVGDLINLNILSVVVVLLVPTALLIFVPAFLGAMISYTTPVVGLSCKSLAPTIYTFSQIVLSILWLTEHSRPGLTQMPKTWYASVLRLAAFSFFVIVSILTSMVASALSFAGVFNNCLCYLPVQYWPNRWSDTRAIIFIAGDTFERERYAELFWLPAGIGAAVFLLIMCYIGWWHQRRLRQDFKAVVEAFEASLDFSIPSNSSGTTHASATSASSIDDQDAGSSGSPGSAQIAMTILQSVNNITSPSGQTAGISVAATSQSNRSPAIT